MTLLDICVIIILVLLGVNLKNFFGGFSKKEKLQLDALYTYHLLITLIFHFFITNFGGDAIHYWEAPRVIPLGSIMEMVSRHYATGVIYLINYIPSKTLNLSLLTGNLIYSTFGFMGFLYIFRIVKVILPDTGKTIKLGRINLMPWIWFLPNFHFWSSGIGKDALLFLAISMFFYASIKLSKNKFLMIIAIILAFAIRPHILLFLLLATFGALIIHQKLKAVYKVLLGIALLLISVFVYGYVLDFVQIESTDASVLSEFVKDRSSKLNRPDVGSGIDISSYSFPYKVFTFLFRPLFYDIKGVLFLLASIENFILLFFTIKVLLSRPYKAFFKAPIIIKSNALFFVVGALTFSLLLGNLGIMLRQKNMFIPWLIIFGLYALYLGKTRHSLNENSNYN